jgi:hypothetical protein
MLLLGNPSPRKSRPKLLNRGIFIGILILMTLTTHAISGAAIASLLPTHPMLAIGAAFASHFLIDAIPHWDYPISSSSVSPQIGSKMKFDKALFFDMTRIGFDALLGLSLAWLLFAAPHFSWIIMLGALVAMIPDPLQFVYAHFKHEPLISLQRFHMWIHTKERLKGKPLLGVASQIAFNIVVILLAFLIRK